VEFQGFGTEQVELLNLLTVCHEKNSGHCPLIDVQRGDIRTLGSGIAAQPRKDEPAGQIATNGAIAIA